MIHVREALAYRNPVRRGWPRIGLAPKCSAARGVGQMRGTQRVAT